MPPRRNVNTAASNNQETAVATGVPKKGPGRPRKATLRGSTENEESVPSAISQTAVVTTATAAENSASEAPPPKVTKTLSKKAAAANALLRDPLPSREGRNEHPGQQKGVEKKTRRTKAQMAADREAEKNRDKEAARKEEAVKKQLVAINLTEQQEADAQLETSRRPLAKALAIKKVTQLSIGSDEEEFPWTEVEYSESEVEIIEKKTKSKSKNVRGALRAEINGMLNERRGGVDVGKSKEQIAGETTNPKKYHNAGLRKDWNAKPVFSRPIAAKSVLTTPGFELGGLNDDDIADIPLVQIVGQVAAGGSRVVGPSQAVERLTFGLNQLVIASKADHGDALKPKAIIPAIREVYAPKQPAGRVASVPVQPAVAPKKNKKQAPRVPEYLSGDWAKKFIPSITHALFVSLEPFKDYKVSSPEFITTLQEVFSSVYPDINHKLSSSDGIAVVAYDRLTAKKSKIASAAIEDVKAFFGSGEFENRPDRIKSYAKWALRQNGPAYFEIPTPRECKALPGDPGYIMPEGAMQSRFISNVAKKFLQQAENSVLEPPLTPTNPPIGLYSLILVAVERAFTCFRATGSFVDPKQFSHENYWKTHEGFIQALCDISEGRWNVILDRVMAPALDVNNDDCSSDSSAVAIQRNKLFIPPTPVKFS